MFKCRKVRGLIAESVYQELAETDRATLERHTATCGSCREEAHALSAMVERIPQSEVLLEQDLVPVLRARLREEAAQVVSPARWGLRYAGALACVLLAVVLGYVVVGGGPGVVDNEPLIVVTASPLERTLETAWDLAESNDFSGAYMALNQGLTDYSGDPLAGTAQRMQADLAFSKLRWYREALADYEALKRGHFASFKDDQESKERLDLLTQARGVDGAFASLHRLDEARRSESFDSYEDVVGDYPATFVASLAAKEMAVLAVHSEQAGNQTVTPVFAMETALARCSHPSAVAQLKMELGNLLAGEANDPTRARAVYQEVAQGDNEELAQLARISLSELEDAH